MRLVVISDTHGMHAEMFHPIPDGDVLIHCGDMTGHGHVEKLIEVADWLGSHPHKHKIAIAGNHDAALWAYEAGAEVRDRFDEAGVNYLEDSSKIIDGVHFYGSPWTPAFCGWYFMLERNSRPLAQKWREIPDDTQVLITHGPPHGVLDAYVDPGYIAKAGGEHVGCEKLYQRVRKLPRLTHHLFGHIHEGYGMLRAVREGLPAIEFVNAAICTRGYDPTNRPQVVDL